MSQIGRIRNESVAWGGWIDFSKDPCSQAFPHSFQWGLAGFFSLNRFVCKETIRSGNVPQRFSPLSFLSISVIFSSRFLFLFCHSSFPFLSGEGEEGREDFFVSDRGILCSLTVRSRVGLDCQFRWISRKNHQNQRLPSQGGRGGVRTQKGFE